MLCLPWTHTHARAQSLAPHLHPDELSRPCHVINLHYRSADRAVTQQVLAIINICIKNYIRSIPNTMTLKYRWSLRLPVLCHKWLPCTPYNRLWVWFVIIFQQLGNELEPKTGSTGRRNSRRGRGVFREPFFVLLGPNARGVEGSRLRSSDTIVWSGHDVFPSADIYLIFSFAVQSSNNVQILRSPYVFSILGSCNTWR